MAESVEDQANGPRRVSPPEITIRVSLSGAHSRAAALLSAPQDHPRRRRIPWARPSGRPEAVRLRLSRRQQARRFAHPVRATDAVPCRPKHEALAAAERVSRKPRAAACESGSVRTRRDLQIRAAACPEQITQVAFIGNADRFHSRTRTLEAPGGSEGRSPIRSTSFLGILETRGARLARPRKGTENHSAYPIRLPRHRATVSAAKKPGRRVSHPWAGARDPRGSEPHPGAIARTARIAPRPEAPRGDDRNEISTGPADGSGARRPPPEGLDHTPSEWASNTRQPGPASRMAGEQALAGFRQHRLPRRASA